MSKPIEPLTCTLDRFENGHAVLLFDFSANNKQEFIIPKRYLPKKIKEKDVLHLELFSETEAISRQKNLAKKILEEILKNE